MCEYKACNKKKYLKTTSDILIKYSSFINNISLINGKMGITIFLYRYARYSNDKLYESYADELLNEIIEELSTDISSSIEDGLCGIVIGIRYLIQNNYIEANIEDLFLEIDNFVKDYKIKENDIFAKQFFFPCIYWIIREKNNSELNVNNLQELLNIVNSISENNNINYIHPILIQSLLFIILNCLENDVQKEKALLIFEQLSDIDGSCFNNDADESFYMLYTLYCEIIKSHKINTETKLFKYLNDNNIAPALSNIIFTSQCKLIYGMNISFEQFDNKIDETLNDTKLTDEFFNLANLNNLSINNHITGFAWALLDYNISGDIKA